MPSAEHDFARQIASLLIYGLVAKSSEAITSMFKLSFYLCDLLILICQFGFATSGFYLALMSKGLRYRSNS